MHAVMKENRGEAAFREEIQLHYALGHSLFCVHFKIGRLRSKNNV